MGEWVSKILKNCRRRLWMVPNTSFLLGEWVSMGVFSDGSYGTTEGVMFSFPVQISHQKWTIVQGLELDDFAKDKLALTGKELCEEREEAMAVCSA